MLALGFGLHLGRRQILWRHRALVAAPWILAISAALTVGGYLWYNLTFVQHQGRYLFPALIPLSLAGGVALSELSRPRAARGAAMILIGAGIVCLVVGALYLAAFSIAAALIIHANSALAPRHRWALSAAVILGLATLAISCLAFFIVPALS